ncbi:hypothetical protein Q6272_28555, partial [Klebsiella pneumoniae]|uniref:hypothetical protein n=1 Tax=Klebsiella pneumoniae TaxID=573 RepID=UPI00276E75A1|nr:hypothetical protein [Klebsiella pneumoniae]
IDQPLHLGSTEAARARRAALTAPIGPRLLRSAGNGETPRVALAAAVLAGGGAAQAQAGPEPFEGRGLLAAGLVGDHLDHWLDLVNATDAQRSQISAIFKA